MHRSADRFSQRGPAVPGRTMASMPELRRRRVYKALLDAMFRYAEVTYGRKSVLKTQVKVLSTSAQYDLYLRGLKTKLRIENNRLSSLRRQEKELRGKIDALDSELSAMQVQYDNAELEKNLAEAENRDLTLPEGFRVLSVPAESFANIVLKATSKAWEEKFNAMKSKKMDSTSSGPDWAKSVDSTGVILSVAERKSAISGKGSVPIPDLRRTQLRKVETEASNDHKHSHAKVLDKIPEMKEEPLQSEKTMELLTVNDVIV